MSSGEIVPGNPATLAEAANEELFYKSAVWEESGHPEDLAVLLRLGGVARELGFLGHTYYVRANRALAVPKTASGHIVEQDEIGDMYDLPFMGTFKWYAKVQIGELEGAGGVQAYCLRFDDVTQTSYPAEILDERTLFVPALAVREIDPIEC